MITKGKITKSISTNSSIYENEGELRRGPWTLEEDNVLIHYITTHGEGRWNSLAQFSGLKRTGKSCRLRWLNYLKPDIKRGNLSPHEQLLILELHSRWGNRWSKIAQNLPGRTDNEIKNYWRTRVQKQARHLKIDSNSKKFLEAIRMFWMPRLIEKMEQGSSLTSSASSSISTMETQKFAATLPVFNHVPVPSIPSPKPTKMLNNLFGNFLVIDSEVWGSHLTPHATQEYDKNVPCGELLVENGYYNIDVPSYDMQEMETRDVFGLSGNHVAGYDWFGEDSGNFVCNNNDEFWQLRKPEEVGF